jgi:hypothetical protein
MDMQYHTTDQGDGLPSGRFVLRIEPGLHAALKAAAEAAGLSLNEYCARSLAAGSVVDEGAARAVVRAAGVLGEDLLGVVVFGSWARGVATAASDVDLLVVCGGGVVISRGLYGAGDEAGPPLEWEGRPVEPHFVGLPARGGRISGLWAEVATDGLVLFERRWRVSRHLAAVRSRIAAGEVERRWSEGGQPYWVEAA